MIIEPVFGYKSAWRILGLLLETPIKPMSRKDIFEYTKLGNAPLSNGLDRLVRAGILIQEKRGKKEFYYVNLANEYALLAKGLWDKERRDTRNLEYDVKVIISEFLRAVSEVCDAKKVILFGSWAKGTASVTSDVDVAVIFDEMSGQDVEVTRIARDLEKKFNKEVQVHCFTENEFGKKNKLTDEIRHDGIWLLGGK